MNMSSQRQFDPKNSTRIPASALAPIERAVEAIAFRAAVRGERSSKGLPASGVPADKREDMHRLHPADVAEGIINLRNDPTALSDWANFILATSDKGDVRGADCDYWDRLLSGIWEIALGNSPKDPLIALAYAVRARQNLA